MVRGSGKFKQKRGGGRNFSKNMVLDENGTAVSVDRTRARNKDGSDDDSDEEEEEEEEESSEEESEEEEKKPELTRAERREAKKKQAAAKTEENDEDEDLINPNHVTKKMNISDLGAHKELSRREREQKEKQEAKDRYWKLHAAGKTDEAKSDLARLAKVRAERAAAEAKRKAEAEVKAAEAEAKKAAQQGRRT